ncbi:MAG: ABC transporter permease [Chloroflexota bacterium]
MLVRIINGLVGLVGGADMLRFLIRRILISIPILFLLILFAFMLVRLIPGGPFSAVGGKERDPRSLGVLNAQYGLDKPLLLNFPYDGIAPDVGMETKTAYESFPDCDKLRQGLSREDATSPTAVEVEQGWALLRLTVEHHPAYVTLTLANGTTERQRCDQTQTVLYSDLARSQFLQYLDNVLRFDFGPSLGKTTRGQSVSDIIGARLPVSMLLGSMAAFFGFLIGIPIGVVAALYRNSVVDYGSTFLMTLLISIPSFVLGPTLIIIFVNVLKVIPGPTGEVWLHPNLLDPNFLSRLVLPLGTLTLGVSAGISRLTRASLLQVLGDDYIRTARAKGMRERGVIYIHALKNALIPVATVLGPLLAGILTGTFFIERIFNIPGLGDTFLSSITDRDYTLLTGTTILYATFLILGNILVDVMYTWLDPRIRFD